MDRRILDRVKRRRQEGEKAGYSVEERDNRGVAGLLNNLTTETAGTEEEAAELPNEALGIEVEETGEGEVEERVEGASKALGSLEFLTQDAELSRTTLNDERNGFNKLSCLEMLWTARHRWSAGARFAFNCYMHWAQLLLCQTGSCQLQS